VIHLENPAWHILLIDEDEDDCLLTRDMLDESQGRRIEMDWAESYEAGLEKLNQKVYDAVLVDFDLRPKNGIDLIRKHAADGYPAPLILYSGQASYETELEALQAGATAYLSKREVTPLLLERLIRYAIERKQAEEQLKESDRTQRALIEKLAADQRKLEAVLASLPVGVWIVDPDGRITGKNKEADRIWAGDAPLLESMDQYEEYVALWADRDERVRPEEYPIAQAAKTGQPVEPVEMRIRRFDGTEGAVLVSAAPIRDDEGALVGVIGINLDITAQRQVQEQLRISEERFSKAFQASPMPFALSRMKDGKIIEVNTSYEELLGTSQTEAVGKTSLEMGVLEDPEDRARVVEIIKEQGKLRNFEIWITARNGQKHLISLSTETLMIEGEPHLLSLFQDITAQRQADEALVEANAAAEEGRRMLEALLKHVPEGIAITGGPPDFRIKYVSQRGLDMTQRKMGEILDLPAGFHQRAWGLKLPDGKTIPDTEQMPLYLAGHYGRETSNMEMIVESSDGTQTPILIKAAPIRDQEGQIVGAINCWLDITERKQAEELAAQKVVEAEAAAHEADLRRAEMDALFEQMQEAVMLYGLDLLPLRVNSRVVETFGFDPTGMTTDEIAQKLTLTNAQGLPWEPDPELIQNVMQGMVIRSETLQITNAAGEHFIVSASCQPINNFAGGMAGVIITWHDVTQREQAAQALRVSEQRYSALFNARTNGIAHCRVITNEQGEPIDYEIIQINDAYEEITGIKREDIEGRRAREVFPGIEHFAYDYIGNYGRVGLYGEELNIEVYFETLQQWLAIYVYSPKPGEFTAIFTDVSQRKRTEQALRESEERFQLARQAIEAVVYDWDPVNNLVHQMDGAHEIFGLPVDETLPVEPGWWQGRIHPEDAAHAHAKLAAALEGKTDSIEDEYRIRHHDGRWIHIWDRAFVLRDENNQATRVVGIAVDITERKEAEGRASFLQRLGRDLNAVHLSEEAGQLVVERLGVFLDVDRCLIAEPDLAARTSRIRFDYQRNGFDMDLPDNFGWPASGISQSLLQDQVVVVEDAQTDPRTAKLYDPYLIKMSTRSFVLVPAVQREGNLPLLAVICAKAHRWNEQDIYFLQQAARLAWLAIERAEITERLQLSEERFRIALKNAPISVFTQDTDLRFIWLYNPLGGFEVEGIVGQLEEGLVPPGEMEGVIALKRAVLETGTPQQEELHIKVKDNWMDVIIDVRPTYNHEGDISGVIGAVMDVTDVRRLQAQQIEAQASNQVQRWLMEHREKERMQLARTLHDKPLQDLLAVHLYLDNILESVGEEFSENMAPVQQMMEQAIEEIRSVALELRPPMLMHMGLEKAIRAYAHTFRQRNPNLLVQLDLEPDRQLLTEDARLALYRIYQELLQNISEHAEAGEVSIVLQFKPDEVVLFVGDDGKGFDTPEQWLDLARTGHFGLVGIQERIGSLNGSIEINTKPGQGTRVIVRAPIG
jgi:PAS domain S-box-containing protein